MSTGREAGSMADDTTIDIVITETGTAKFIYSDDAADALGAPRCASCSITRASHVEPTPAGRWVADMRPAIALMTGEQIAAFWRDVEHRYGIVSDAWLVLGPFDTRQEALDAEVAWLKQWAGV
jgi:hypothetical protein